MPTFKKETRRRWPPGVVFKKIDRRKNLCGFREAYSWV